MDDAVLCPIRGIWWVENSAPLTDVPEERLIVFIREHFPFPPLLSVVRGEERMVTNN